jgi:hypothetical protein
MSSLPGVPSLAAAITQAEGVNPAYSNPGALSNGDVGYGTFGQGLTIYGDLEAGEQALYNQLLSIANGTSKYYNQNMTLSEFGQTYSGNPNYGNTLASILGVSPNTSVGSVLNGSPAVSSPAQVSTGTAVGSSGVLGSVLDNVGLGGIQSSIDSYVSNTLFSSRLVLLLIGFLLIGAGLFSFKSTQTVIQTVGKHVGEAAA